MFRADSIVEIFILENVLFVIIHYDGSRIRVSGASIASELHFLMQHCLQ